MRKFLSLGIIILCFMHTAYCQFQFDGWINSGHNRAAGWYGNIDLRQEYKLNKTVFTLNEEFAVFNAQNSFFNAGEVKIKQYTQIKSFEFTPFVSFTYRPFSKYVREKVYAFGIIRYAPRWNLMLGNFTRIFSLSKEMQELYPNDDASNLKEWHNLLYDIEFLFQPREDQNKLNISLGVSNKSDLLYHGPTLPMIYSTCWTHLNDKQYIFLEARYQTAGSNNLQADYFGVILKGGFHWAL